MPQMANQSTGIPTTTCVCFPGVSLAILFCNVYIYPLVVQYVYFTSKDNVFDRKYTILT